MVCQERLVRRDDVRTRIDCGEHQRPSGLDTPHEFNHDVGFADELLGIGRQKVRRNYCVARGLEVAYGNPHQFNSRTDPSGELVAMVQNLIRDLRADTPRAEEGDSQVPIFDHRVFLPKCMSRDSKSASVSRRTVDTG